ncbi:MAG: hypothetical protein J5700_05970, partial [Treponema sp.]|nr:hypothetical protein [Treponema sp.]
MDFFKKVKNAANLAAVAIAISIFAACSGLAGDSGSSSQDAAQSPSASGKNLATIKGTVGVAGAVPQEIQQAAASAQNDGARSAIPTLDDTYYYYVKTLPQGSNPNPGKTYTAKDDPATITFTPGSNGTQFELALEYGEWKIECGLMNADGHPVLSATSQKETLTASNSVMNVNLSAAPVARLEDGTTTGKIKLEVTKTSSVDSLKVYCQALWGDMTAEPGVEDGKYVINVESVPGSSGGVPAGAYDLTLSFYNTSGVMVYQTVQTVNVFAGMTTNTWVSGGDATNDSKIISDAGVFAVETAALNSFKKTTFYVSDSGDNGNEGSHLKPLKTLQAAVDAIKATGSDDKDYNIFVRGTVQGNTEFSSALDGVGGSAKKARSITISNVDGESGAVIEGGRKTADSTSVPLNVLTVATAVPITIKGVK